MGELSRRRRIESALPQAPKQFGRVDTANRADYLGALQNWNDRLNEHLRLIRVLESVRWSKSVEHEFFAAGCRELPRIAAADYRQAIPFSNLPDRLADLRQLERQIAVRLGPDSPAARLLLRHCRSAQDAFRLIAARGTREFVWLSREIYGTSQGSKPSRDRLLRLIQNFESTPDDTVVEGWLTADEAAAQLSQRLGAYFGAELIHVHIVDSLNADACAGSGYLKLRRHARFSKADIDLLEVHEGWAHLGTMINGRRQPLFTSLARSAPCTTSTQEGLAVFTELLAGFCHPQRRRKLARRLRGVMMAEEGADFLQVFAHFNESGCGEREAYRQTARVFRGSLPADLGPFTKDLGYGLGLLELVAHLRSSKDEDGRTIPLLFAGKTCLEDIPDLAEIHEVGLLIPGELIPPPFRNRRRVRTLLGELGAW